MGLAVGFHKAGIHCLQEEKLARIGPLVEVHQRRDKALVELERLDEVRAKVFKEGGWVNVKQVPPPFDSIRSAATVDTSNSITALVSARQCERALSKISHLLACRGSFVEDL